MVLAFPCSDFPLVGWNFLDWCSIRWLNLVYSWILISMARGSSIQMLFKLLDNFTFSLVASLMEWNLIQNHYLFFPLLFLITPNLPSYYHEKLKMHSRFRNNQFRIIINRWVLKFLINMSLSHLLYQNKLENFRLVSQILILS